jgi:hypothetical protein
MKTVRTKQQNRSKRAAAVLFNDQAKDIENIFERNARSNHLENALFTSEQRFVSLAVGHIAVFKSHAEACKQSNQQPRVPPNSIYPMVVTPPSIPTSKEGL